jgi:alpha-glucosidase
VSHFGGPAWTHDPASGQYYLHLFLPEQPDLDWSNLAVRDEFDRILRFWLDRGIDGFRVDVAHALVKDAGLRDNPMFVEPAAGATAEEIFHSFHHRHDLDQPGVTDIYRRWRGVAADYDGLLLGEVYLQDPAALARYVDDALDLSFCFALLYAPWDADSLRGVVRACVDSLGDAAAWPISSHDDPRAPTRFGGGEAGRDRALALTTSLAFAPGIPFLYQGDELGLVDASVSLEDAVDPVAVRNRDPAQGRDGVRTPFPWEHRPGLGFTAGTPWLPDGGRVEEDTAGYQRGRAGSPLERHRTLLALRRRWRDLLEPLVWDEEGFSYRRGPLHVTVNCGQEPLRVERDGSLLFGTDRSVVLDGDQLTIPPDHAAVVELR